MQSCGSIIGKNATLVPSTDSELFKFLEGMAPGAGMVRTRSSGNDRRQFTPMTGMATQGWPSPPESQSLGFADSQICPDFPHSCNMNMYVLVIRTYSLQTNSTSHT